LEQLVHPGVERIAAGGCTLAIVLRREAAPPGSGFVSARDDDLQVGVRRYGESDRVARHVHEPVARSLTGTSEFLLVRTGHCLVDLYDAREHRVAEVELHPGDGIVLLAGGHGIRMLDETSLLEVKQGPYGGPREKRRF
jgi:hypothetical protein